MELLRGSLILSLVVYFFYLVDYSLQLNKRIVLINLERPKVTDINKEYALMCNFTSFRHGRRDPIHYVDIRVHFIQTIGSDAGMRLQFLEFLSNEYRPSFVEMNFKLCDFFQFMPADILYTTNYSLPFRPYQLYSHNTCAIRMGIYHFTNMTVSINHPLLKNFPLEKGRVIVTLQNKHKVIILRGHIDLEVTMKPIVRKKN